MKLGMSLLTVAALAVAGTSFAKEHGTPNCEVKGKKEHVKDKAACEKKKGHWVEEGATTGAPAEAPAAPAAPAEGAHK